MKRIELRGINGIGKFALIDDCDYELLNKYKWYLNNNGYAVTSIRINGKKKSLFMHRLIMKLTNPNIYIDHRNQKKLENQKSNLRFCSHSQNQMNSKKRKTWKGEECSSTFKGVSYFKRDRKWKSQIEINYKVKHLGYFTSEIEAAEVYDKAAKKYFKEFANLNFQDKK